MKFEYDGEGERAEMVAFVDNEGDLCIKVGSGVCYLMRHGDGFANREGDLQEYADDNGVKRAFYPGDKITITF